MANLTVYRAHLARRDPYTTNTALARRLRLHVLGPQPGGTARHAGGSRGASTRHPRCAPRAPSDNVKNARRAAPSARAHRSPWRSPLLKPAGGGPARGVRKAPPARLPRGARTRQHGGRREHRARATGAGRQGETACARHGLAGGAGGRRPAHRRVQVGLGAGARAEAARGSPRRAAAPAAPPPLSGSDAVAAAALARHLRKHGRRSAGRRSPGRLAGQPASCGGHALAMVGAGPAIAAYLENLAVSAAPTSKVWPASSWSSRPGSWPS